MERPRVLWHPGAMRRLLALALLAAVAGCGSPEQRGTVPTAPIAVTPPGERADAPVVRRELPDQPVPPLASIPSPGARPGTEAQPSAAPIVLPADAIYVCVVDQGGTRHQTVIEFVPKVHQLCRRHPEMGPCQYERNVCRNAGGRVFAAGGQEITMATEAEYDRKVMRVRFRAN
jgi:hypothetical protein